MYRLVLVVLAFNVKLVTTSVQTNTVIHTHYHIICINIIAAIYTTDILYRYLILIHIMYITHKCYLKLLSPFVR